MVSIFPDLFSYAIFIPFIFRLFLGLNLIKQARIKYQAKSKTAFVYGVFGALLLIGLFVQVVAILGFVYQFAKIRRSSDRDNILQYGMALIYFALIFLGPGIWSIDLPL